MGGGSDEVPELLHGILDVIIFEAEHLHHSIPGAMLHVTEKLEESLHLGGLGHSKLYATVDIGSARVAHTREAEYQPQNPRWNESFRLYCAHTAAAVTVSVKSQLPVSAHVHGRAHVPVSALLRAGHSSPIDAWLDLFSEDGSKHGKARIHVRLAFTHAAADPSWDAGVTPPPHSGLPNSFFPARTGCHVTLYQNSHLSDDFRPTIRLAGRRLYSPPRLWEDLYRSIAGARHFIYVAGWSVNVNTRLVRDPERMIPGAEGVTIGELLKKKADEGVNVLVMVWQDQTSISLLGNAGLMKTHDEETRKFFEGTKVRCFLCPRHADHTLTAVQHIEIDTEFTHHQKAVSLDAPASSNANDPVRKVVSFVGGIDLCGGRYDDEKHTLFRDLDTVYVDDFQQNNFSGADLKRGGPREPWHDVHSKIEGLAAWDVLSNFEHRWTKQAPKDMLHCLFGIHDNPEIFPPPANLDTDESWNVQIFRSIDDASVTGFPSNPSDATKMGLMSSKDVTIDQSIHSAYIEAIRRARRFIYIENQYFFGSCASWKEDQDCGCLNLVPIEIALKIASKIRQGERFAAYIVTPMWPEGEPEGDTVQAILHWNRLTMEMMYGIVAKAIKDAGLDGTDPCDYLNFFCLGNREVQLPGEYVPPERPEPGSDYYRAQINRRFLIYVHAKLMIVDDEYVIVGSANLNQRSLEGNRDTEIAHGSYQPSHLNGVEGNARGLIHGYRMSLWYEHFINLCPRMDFVYYDPETLNSVRYVKEKAMELWEKFVGDEVVDLHGHLLPFPRQVSESGELSELTEDGFFPDTKAPIRGKKSSVLPPILTT